MDADGRGVMAIMHEVGVSKRTVWHWQEYFGKAGVEGSKTKRQSKNNACPNLATSASASASSNHWGASVIALRTTDPNRHPVRIVRRTSW